MRSDLLEAATLRLPTRAVFAVLAVTALALAALLMDARPAHAATFAVSKTADTNDGTCDADCSLREAIVAANSNPGADTIDVPASTYTLAIIGRNEDAAATGDLDVTDELTITGAGAQSTTIDANGIDRVFEGQPGVKLTISRMTIKGGDPGGAFGGGVRVGGGGANLTLNDSVITGNKNAIAGGGLSLGSGTSATATLNNDTIRNNTATNDGGGIDTENGILMVTNSTINDNTATAFGGGGLQSVGGTATLTNDTFSGNKAGNVGGGGIDQIFGTVMLTNVTINENTINSGGGGGVQVGGGGTAKFQNSIVANSSGGTDCSTSLPPPGTLTSQGNNLSTDASCNFTASGDIQNQDPKLGPLQNNGGPTQTYALLAGSPAIDAGSNTGCPTTDQRGVARPQDGDNNGSAVCDIGAFELVVPPVAKNDSYSVNQDQTLNVPAPGVLANDSDPNAKPLTAVQVSGPSHGTLALNPDGSFTYKPNSGFSGTDSFTYKVSNGVSDSNIVTVTITVKPVGEPPPPPSPPPSSGPPPSGTGHHKHHHKQHKHKGHHKQHKAGGGKGGRCSVCQ